MKKVLMFAVVIILIPLLFSKPLKFFNRQNTFSPIPDDYFFNNFNNLRERIHRMIEESFRDFDTMFSTPLMDKFNTNQINTFSIKSDVYEKDGNFIVKCDLPGMDKNDVKIFLDNNSLVIEGERKTEVIKKQNYYLHERSYGKFMRRILLPPYVDKAKIKAKFEKGTLTVIIPIDKSKMPKRRYIKIE